MRRIHSSTIKFEEFFDDAISRYGILPIPGATAKYLSRVSKESKAELSEAVNSMHKWYENAFYRFVLPQGIEESDPDAAGFDESQ